MSRLDVFVARMFAQVSCLNWAAEEIAGLEGCVFELGLGNGRTYDHLRGLFPARDIFVFDHKAKSHPDCVPPMGKMILGDVMKTLVVERARFGGKVALMHVDIGGHDLQENDLFARALSPLLVPFMCPGGIIMSTDRFYVDSWKTLDLPPGVDPREGFLYQA